MRSSWSIGVMTTVLAQTVFLNTAVAAVFPDVPDGHLYQEPIERLVGLKIVNGNPDGKFNPSRSVNRAEMLIMLYRALGTVPTDVKAKCFTDVDVASWYAAVVCDASANRYVEGYNDGRFRPEKEVNRVEALKMITNFFNIPVRDMTEGDRNLVKFVDVSLTAWYTKYLYAAFTNGILPIAGQDGPRFYPDAPLLRGEAAAYIFNALSLLDTNKPTQSSSVAGVNAAQAEGRRSSAAQKSSAPGPVIKQVDFPFSDDGNFTAKRSILYRFTLKNSVVGDWNVRLIDTSGKVTCRLFRLADDGLSAEYYLGLQVHETCHIRTALTAGSYQLDIQPTIADAKFSVVTRPVESDGNDGFSEAKILTRGIARSGAMAVDNYADWYTFTIDAETILKLEVSSTSAMDTFIYPMENVDLYGFSGPIVGQTYTYPPGTYYVGVRRGDPELGKQSYTIQLK